MMTLDPEPWTRDALCAQTDPEIFFPEEDWQTARKAKTICARCDVRAACLAYALRNRETDGVWGGLAPKERQRLRRAAA